MVDRRVGVGFRAFKLWVVDVNEDNVWGISLEVEVLVRVHSTLSCPSVWLIYMYDV